MNNTGVLIILVVFGVGALLAAAIPGLALGIPLGMLVSRRDIAFAICLAVSLIGAVLVSVWVKKFDPVTFFVVLGALMTMTIFGVWIGRKLACAGKPE